MIIMIAFRPSPPPPWRQRFLLVLRLQIGHKTKLGSTPTSGPVPFLPDGEPTETGRQSGRHHRLLFLFQCFVVFGFVVVVKLFIKSVMIECCCQHCKTSKKLASSTIKAKPLLGNVTCFTPHHDVIMLLPKKNRIKKWKTNHWTNQKLKKRYK